MKNDILNSIKWPRDTSKKIYDNTIPYREKHLYRYVNLGS